MELIGGGKRFAAATTLGLGEGDRKMPSKPKSKKSTPWEKFLKHIVDDLGWDNDSS